MLCSLHNLFREADVDESGTLTVEEFNQAIETSTDAVETLKQLDIKRNQIDWLFDVPLGCPREILVQFLEDPSRGSVQLQISVSPEGFGSLRVVQFCIPVRVSWIHRAMRLWHRAKCRDPAGHGCQF